MRNLILKKTKTAIFLTIVLIGGTFAAISPSFITGVNAEPYYGIDNDRKSDKKDVSVQSLKCNNINVNVNGLELSVLPPFIGSEVAATSAEDDKTNANSFANNNGESNSDSQINDFRFICINKNNNTVIEEETPINHCAAAEDIETCFAEFLDEGQFPAFVAALESGITVEINGQEITLTSFEDICAALEGLTFEQLADTLDEIVNAAIAPPGEIILITLDFVTCFAESLDIPIPSG